MVEGQSSVKLFKPRVWLPAPHHRVCFLCRKGFGGLWVVLKRRYKNAGASVTIVQPIAVDIGLDMCGGWWIIDDDETTSVSVCLAPGRRMLYQGMESNC